VQAPAAGMKDINKWIASAGINAQCIWRRSWSCWSRRPSSQRATNAFYRNIQHTTKKPRSMQILELLEHTPIFSAGYKCILHIHSVVEECECTEMRYELDPKTKSKKKVLQGMPLRPLAAPLYGLYVS
jgi:hypothetical protein